jgi:monoamine oxidase
MSDALRHKGAASGPAAMRFAARAGLGQSSASHNHEELMPRLSRRSFLAASAALIARPALAATTAPTTTAVDIVIIGAGAAGIAAARRVAAAGRPFVLLEAADHSGGRCVTDTAAFGVPYDRGAHWIHAPDLNPLAKLAGRGLDIYPAPPSQKVRIGRRNAREGELEDFLSLQVRSNRAIRDLARKVDAPCAQALPNDLGDWRQTVEFVLGPYGCAKDLTQVSAFDYAKSAEREVDAFCRQGFGALLAKLADGVPVKLSTPVSMIDWHQNVAVVTPAGTITARAAILTASTGLIGSGKIKFSPDLPKRQLDACEKLSLGSYDHIALELAGNPLGLQSDDLVFEKSSDTRTAAILGNVSGTPLCMIEVAGSFGRELSGQGDAAMVAFATDWLASLYGSDIKDAIRRTHATRWNADPWTLGAFSAAAPGAQGARRILMVPLHDAFWFAGEAAHETLWGTVGGAWASGERAADAALRRLGTRTAEPPLAERKATSKSTSKSEGRSERKSRRTSSSASKRRGRSNRDSDEQPSATSQPTSSIMRNERR